MKSFFLAIVVVNFACHGESAVKVWKHDNDILNPEHWVGGKSGKQCKGLDLRDATESTLVVDKLKAREILLPNFTTIYLMEDASITLDENNLGELNCVKVKDNFKSYRWQDPSSWIIENVEEHLAIPHTERIPCNYDDVVFPKGWKSSICIMDDFMGERDYIRLRSFKFEERYYSDSDLRLLARSEIPLFPPNFHRIVVVEDMSCNDRTGCMCGNYIYDGVCDYVEEPQKFDCVEPFLPIDFCTKICGASVLIKNIYSPEFLRNFDLEGVKKTLKGYTSITHISKVQRDEETMIQIIFTEKEFTGTSLDEAKDFQAMLLADSSFAVTEALVMTSGVRYHEGDITRTALTLFFGCLCSVLLVFALIFFVNSPYFANWNLPSRYRFSSAPLSSLLARYEKMDDERLHFRKAESVVSLEKAFDNPLYGTPAPSTASTSTVTSSEEKDSGSGIRLENPMYDINNFGESSVEEIKESVDENPLVELTSFKKSNEKSEGDLIPLQ